MAKEVQLTDNHKLTYLRSAIKCQAGQDNLNIGVCAGNDYPSIVASLQRAFEQKRMVFREYLQGLVRQKLRDSSYHELAEGMSMTNELKQSECFSHEYMITALLEMGMSESVYEVWLEHTLMSMVITCSLNSLRNALELAHLRHQLESRQSRSIILRLCQLRSWSKLKFFMLSREINTYIQFAIVNLINFINVLSSRKCLWNGRCK